MKVPEKSKEKKEKIKKKEKMKPKKEYVVIVAQEINFARMLSGNEKKTRDKVLNTLKKWILNCFEKGYEFKEDDFTRLWKGLFYAVWMSDKPLVQEELCEKIAGVIDLFPEDKLRSALLMFKAGLRILATEWYGLDQHRTDKFLMLVRRYLRASLRCLLRSKWSLKSCQMYAKTLSGSDGILALKTPHFARNSLSMSLHFVDCYLEEIAKVSNGDIPDASLVELLRPVCTYMCGGEVPALCTAARRVLTALVRQSDQGLQYQQATAAWQKMGCPEGGPEALELVSDSEDEDDKHQQDENNDDDDEDGSSEKPLDPRAGRVNVELPCLPVPAKLIADMLREMLATASSGRHKRVKICLQRFEQLARSEYPLRVQTHAEDTPAPKIKQKKSAQTLHALEKKLVAASDELALRGLSRKHRKRLLAKSRAGTSIVEELDTTRQKLSTDVTNGGWKVEETVEPEAKKSKPNTTNKETKKRKNNLNDSDDVKKRKVNGDATPKQHDGDATPKQHHGDATPKQHQGDATPKQHHGDATPKRHHGDATPKQHQGDAKPKQHHGDATPKQQQGDATSKRHHGDATSKRYHGDKKQKVAKETNSMVNKLDNAKRIENSQKKENPSQSGQKKDKIIQNGQKIKDKKNRKEKIIKESVKIDKNKITVVLDIMTQNGKNNKKPVKIADKLLVKNKKPESPSSPKQAKNPTLLVNKVKQFQKKTEFKKPRKLEKKSESKYDSPKKVKFVLKNNSMQQPVDYYKSVKQSPSIPFDSSKKPSKTNLKPSTPSPINPFFKKKLRLKQ